MLRRQKFLVLNPKTYWKLMSEVLIISNANFSERHLDWGRKLHVRALASGGVPWGSVRERRARDAHALGGGRFGPQLAGALCPARCWVQIPARAGRACEGQAA